MLEPGVKNAESEKKLGAEEEAGERGRLASVVVGAGLFELANTMAVWAWNVQPNPLPLVNSVYGFFLTSLVYGSFSILGLGKVWKGGEGDNGSPPGGLE